jgi:hypothetical protein
MSTQDRLRALVAEQESELQDRRTKHALLEETLEKAKDKNKDTEYIEHYEQRVNSSKDAIDTLQTNLDENKTKLEESSG